MSTDHEVPGSGESNPEQQHISPASLVVEAIAAAIALAFTILLLKEVLPFLN